MKRNAAITLNANMTPMIDVTFLLIVFFVVVSQIVDRDVIPLDLPTPNDARATVSESENRMVINVVPLDNGEVAGIVVGDHTIASLNPPEIIQDSLWDMARQMITDTMLDTVKCTNVIIQQKLAKAQKSSKFKSYETKYNTN